MNQIFNYENKDLLEFHSKEFNLSLKNSEEIFNEFKYFMFLKAKGDSELIPTIEIDRIWHTFLLFTNDYEKFCSTLGVFIHHRPKIGRAHV